MYLHSTGTATLLLRVVMFLVVQKCWFVLSANSYRYISVKKNNL